MPKTKVVKTVKKAARPRYRSRATRLGEAETTLNGIVGDLREIANEIDEADEEENDNPKETAERLSRARDILKGAADAKAEIESLTEEMTTWRDNEEGTALENTNRHERVVECADTLEALDLDCLEADIIDPSNVAEVADDIDNLVSEIQGIDFPGMYG